MTEFFKMFFRSCFIAIFLMIAICFESMKARMSVIILIYSFAFFMIIKKWKKEVNDNESKYRN